MGVGRGLITLGVASCAVISAAAIAPAAGPAAAAGLTAAAGATALEALASGLLGQNAERGLKSACETISRMLSSSQFSQSEQIKGELPKALRIAQLEAQKELVKSFKTRVRKDNESYQDEAQHIEAFTSAALTYINQQIKAARGKAGLKLIGAISEDDISEVLRDLQQKQSSRPEAQMEWLWWTASEEALNELIEECGDAGVAIKSGFARWHMGEEGALSFVRSAKEKLYEQYDTNAKLRRELTILHQEGVEIGIGVLQARLDDGLGRIESALTAAQIDREEKHKDVIEGQSNLSKDHTEGQKRQDAHHAKTHDILLEIKGELSAKIKSLSEDEASFAQHIKRHCNQLQAYSLRRLSELSDTVINRPDEISTQFAKRQLGDNAGRVSALTAITQSLLASNQQAGQTTFNQHLVLADAGEGKTIFTHTLLSELSDVSFVKEAGIVPILADCVTLARLIGKYSKTSDARALIAEWLKIALYPGAGMFAESGAIDAFVETAKENDLRVLFVIDGLDELDPSGQASDKLQFLFNSLTAWCNEVGLEFILLATSRRADPNPDYDPRVAEARVWGLRPIELLPLQDSDLFDLINRFSETQTRKLSKDAANLVLTFFKGQDIDRKIVYLKPLIRYVMKHPRKSLSGRLTNIVLLEQEVRDIVGVLHRQLKERDIVFSCHPKLVDKLLNDLLVEIALLSLNPFDEGLPNSLSKTKLRKKIDEASLRQYTNSDQFSDVLLERFLHVLIYVSRDELDNDNAYYRLPHNEYRDFIIANALFHWINKAAKQEEPLKSDVLLSLASSYLKTERTPVFLDQMIIDQLGEPSNQKRQAFAKKLIKKMNTELPNAAPDKRTEASPHGAMLTLLMSLGPIPSLKIDAKGKSFQGAKISADSENLIKIPFSRDARGASFREAKLRMADLSEIDFTDAVFDNAELNGASFANSRLKNCNLRNASMGQHSAWPTNFEGADLTGSDWFNYRSSFNGFFNLWDLELVETENESYLLATGSDGLILAFDLARSELGPVELQTPHTDEIMDLARHPTRPIIATTSRDRKICLFRLPDGTPNEWTPKQRSLDSIHPPTDYATIEAFKNSSYPRRARFGASGRWMTVIARDPRVAFFPVDDDNRLGDPILGNAHHGPVMCLVADTEEFANSNGGHVPDTFLSAGYDGAIAVWREHMDDPMGWRTPSASSNPEQLVSQQHEIIRALAPNADLTGIWSGTEHKGLVSLYNYDDEAMAIEQTQGFGAVGGVFALAVHAASPSLIAVGFSTGRVKVFRSDITHIDQYDWDTPLLDVEVSDDIVRSAVFSASGQELFVATWDAVILRYDLMANKLKSKFHFPEEKWKPEIDAKEIRLGPGRTTLQGVEGVSSRMKAYLYQVNNSGK